MPPLTQCIDIYIRVYINQESVEELQTLKVGISKSFHQLAPSFTVYIIIIAQSNNKCFRMSFDSTRHDDYVDNVVNYKIEISVSGFTRQVIENKYNMMIPIDIQTLCFIYSKDLLFDLFVTFKLIKMEKEINNEKKEIESKTAIVESELVEAKPALESAQKAVSNINKKQLNEIKCLKNPPKLIEFTMNAVAVLIGKKIKDWKGMQKLLASNSFIPSILKFDTNKVKEKTRKKLNKCYLSNEDFTFERVNKASKVAGPLVIWVKSQVKFAHLLDSVEPMTKEIKELKVKLNEKELTAEKLKAMLLCFD